MNTESRHFQGESIRIYFGQYVGIFCKPVQSHLPADFSSQEIEVGPCLVISPEVNFLPSLLLYAQCVAHYSMPSRMVGLLLSASGIQY